MQTNQGCCHKMAHKLPSYPFFRNKQIVAKRLSIAGANIAYNIKSNPTNGPFPAHISVEEGSTMVLKYDQDFTYDTSEISGFYICCINYSNCNTNEAWQAVDRSRVKAYLPTTIEIDLKDICGDGKTSGLAYLWEDIPTKRVKGLPIYSSDNFGLPAAPWKTEITLFVKK